MNGLPERMNRTIMERVRSMLSNAKLSKSYWVEAMYMIVYLINKSPLMPLKGDLLPTLEDVWMFGVYACG